MKSKEHVHYTFAAFCKLSEPMGSNYIQARSKELGCSRLLAAIAGSYPVAGLDVCHLGALSGRGLCVGLVACPEESHRVWCVLSVIVKLR